MLRVLIFECCNLCFEVVLFCLQISKHRSEGFQSFIRFLYFRIDGVELLLLVGNGVRLLGDSLILFVDGAVMFRDGFFLLIDLFSHPLKIRLMFGTSREFVVTSRQTIFLADFRCLVPERLGTF